MRWQRCCGVLMAVLVWVGAPPAAAIGTSPKETALAQFRGSHVTAASPGLRGKAKPNDFPWDPVVVVVAHSRKEYLSKTLCALLAVQGVQDYTVVLSLDNPSFKHTAQGVIDTCRRQQEAAGRVANTVDIWLHQPETRPQGFHAGGLYKIARHFRLAMNAGFVERSYTHMILLEEDLVVSPDFLALFRETAWLLHVDHSLWCVSAWNDNGFRSLATNEARLFRTGYFPGLGWMLRRQLWVDELASIWPEAASTGWDHWMRLSSVSKGRECVVPEVPRTKHIGDKGANVNAESAKMYHDMRFATRDAGAEGSSFGDLFYLMQEAYERLIQDVVSGAVRVAGPSFLTPALQSRPDGAALLIAYERREWKRLAPRVGLPSGPPRSTHKGAAIISFKGVPLILADKRACPYLLPAEQIRPNANVQYLAASQGQSCTRACSAAGKRCAGDHLQWANSCAVLATLFPCEAGCGHQVGTEIPCYVQDASQVTHQQCLTTDTTSESCEAAHHSTRRACPCL